MHPLVLVAMEGLNIKFGTSYNVCVLNYYKDRHQHLGWHADDSPEQDLDHPIAVVAFGATRQIWWKHKSLKGPIPDDQKVDMTPGLLFIMPGGFQAEHVHRSRNTTETAMAASR
jgi:alkylated DNA repair dioxygenase AlkB